MILMYQLLILMYCMILMYQLYDYVKSILIKNSLQMILF